MIASLKCIPCIFLDFLHYTPLSWEAEDLKVKSRELWRQTTGLGGLLFSWVNHLKESLTLPPPGKSVQMQGLNMMHATHCVVSHAVGAQL